MPAPPPSTLIIMGVSGSGKTRIGKMLAESLGGIFEDADHFHPPENIAKMSAGIPLDDADRRPWYTILRNRILEMRAQTPCYILACSALKQTYRDWLRDGDTSDQMAFVFLSGERETIRNRLNRRKGHYMPASLLDSQFEALEPPKDAIVVDIERTPRRVVEKAISQIREMG